MGLSVGGMVVGGRVVGATINNKKYSFCLASVKKELLFCLNHSWIS